MGKDNNPVIIRLAGGLGNQLFQYAVGRALSLRLGNDLEIEHSRFLEDRHYELANFNIPASIKVYADKKWLPRSIVSIANRFAKIFLKKQQLFLVVKILNLMVDTYQKVKQEYWGVMMGLIVVMIGLLGEVIPKPIFQKQMQYMHPMMKTK